MIFDTNVRLLFGRDGKCTFQQEDCWAKRDNLETSFNTPKKADSVLFVIPTPSSLFSTDRSKPVPLFSSILCLYIVVYANRIFMYVCIKSSIGTQGEVR